MTPVRGVGTSPLVFASFAVFAVTARHGFRYREENGHPTSCSQIVPPSTINAGSAAVVGSNCVWFDVNPSWATWDNAAGACAKVSYVNGNGQTVYGQLGVFADHKEYTDMTKWMQAKWPVGNGDLYMVGIYNMRDSNLGSVKKSGFKWIDSTTMNNEQKIDDAKWASGYPVTSGGHLCGYLGYENGDFLLYNLDCNETPHAYICQITAPSANF